MREKIETVVKIRLQYEKRNIVWLLLAIVTAAVLSVTSGYPWWVAVIFVPVYYLIKSLQITLTEKLKAVWIMLELFFGAWFTVFTVQYVILPKEQFIRTSNEKWFLNILVVFVIGCVVQFLLNNTAFTAAFTEVSLLGLAFADYFVYSFRGNELTYADMRSAGTGLSVAANYTFTIEPRCGYALLLAILYIALSRKISFSIEGAWGMRVVLCVAAAVSAIYISERTASVNTETWEQKGSYRNGYLLNFCLQVRDSFVAAPEGYDPDQLVGMVREVEEAYEPQKKALGLKEGQKPTVICIMSESFADLKVIGDFDTNRTLTPFLDSLKWNTVKGYALASVYSAKTPNSEWEFMTGNSMAFIPQGSVVYQQFIDEEPNSLVSTMKNEGYTCVAMHPYYETGWSRNQIYPTMGFDEMYFIEDFDETQLMRKYITDKEFYRKIIERFEKRRSGEDLFIMSISMQNHGGYGEEYDNFDPYICKTGPSYKDVNQYLQLVHETDKATEELIRYFQRVDEPVEIVFFGDHQPGLNSSFYRLLNGKGLAGLTAEELQAIYTVPFFIWTNYETPAEEVEITSLNYLSTLALERAGIELPLYNQFLKELMEEIPAMNSQGYYSAEDQSYHYYSELSEEESAWIDRYHLLQYNNMFDAKHRNNDFFPYLR